MTEGSLVGESATLTHRTILPRSKRQDVMRRLTYHALCMPRRILSRVWTSSHAVISATSRKR